MASPQRPGAFLRVYSLCSRSDGESWSSTLHTELIPSHPCSLAVFGERIPGALGYWKLCIESAASCYTLSSHLGDLHKVPPSKSSGSLPLEGGPVVEGHLGHSLLSQCLTVWMTVILGVYSTHKARQELGPRLQRLSVRLCIQPPPPLRVGFRQLLHDLFPGTVPGRFLRSS